MDMALVNISCRRNLTTFENGGMAHDIHSKLACNNKNLK